MFRTIPRRWLALALVPIAGLAACGDDNDDTAAPTAAPAATAAATSAAPTPTAATGGVDLATFCSTSMQLTQLTAMGPQGDDVDAGQAFAASILPLGEQLLASAPPSVTADLEQMVAVTETVVTSGDVSAFESAEFAALDANVHAAGVDGCGWARHDVELMDYHIMGLPESVPAGATTFELENTGKEFHEMVLVKKNDGVIESFEDILRLPEEEAFAKVTFMGVGFAAPGATGYVVSDLTPGDYLAVCFIPVGTVDLATAPGADAPPHFTQGMQHEFTVS